MAGPGSRGHGHANSMHIVCTGARGMSLPGGGPCGEPPKMLRSSAARGGGIVEMVNRRPQAARHSSRRIRSRNAAARGAGRQRIDQLHKAPACDRHRSPEWGGDASIFNDLGEKVPVTQAVAPKTAATDRRFEAAGEREKADAPARIAARRNAMTVTAGTWRKKTNTAGRGRFRRGGDPYADRPFSGTSRPNRSDCRLRRARDDIVKLGCAGRAAKTEGWAKPSVTENGPEAIFFEAIQRATSNRPVLVVRGWDRRVMGLDGRPASPGSCRDRSAGLSDEVHSSADGQLSGLVPQRASWSP